MNLFDSKNALIMSSDCLYYNTITRKKNINAKLNIDSELGSSKLFGVRVDNQ